MQAGGVFDSASRMVAKVNQERKLRHASEDALIALQRGFTSNVYKMQEMELSNERLQKEIDEIKVSHESLRLELDNYNMENNFLRVRASIDSFNSDLSISSTLLEYERPKTPDQPQEVPKALEDLTHKYNELQTAFNQYRTETSKEQDELGELSKQLADTRRKYTDAKKILDAISWV